MQDQVSPQNHSQGSGKAERMLGWTALVYGLVILNPWTEVLLYCRGCFALVRFGGEEIWGAGIATIGLVQLLAWKSGKRKYRVLAAIMSTLMWLFLCFMFFLGRLGDLHLVSSWITALLNPGVVWFALWAYFQVEILVEFRHSK